MTQNDWTTKETQIQEDFIWGFGPAALYRMKKAEYNIQIEQNCNERFRPVI